jgi:hypothetical protein
MRRRRWSATVVANTRPRNRGQPVLVVTPGQWTQARHRRLCDPGSAGPIRVSCTALTRSSNASRSDHARSTIRMPIATSITRRDAGSPRRPSSAIVYALRSSLALDLCVPRADERWLTSPPSRLAALTSGTGACHLAGVAPGEPPFRAGDATPHRLFT